MAHRTWLVIRLRMRTTDPVFLFQRVFHYTLQKHERGKNRINVMKKNKRIMIKVVIYSDTILQQRLIDKKSSYAGV